MLGELEMNVHFTVFPNVSVVLKYFKIKAGKRYKVIYARLITIVDFI